MIFLQPQTQSFVFSPQIQIIDKVDNILIISRFLNRQSDFSAVKKKTQLSKAQERKSEGKGMARVI